MRAGDRDRWRARVTRVSRRIAWPAAVLLVVALHLTLLGQAERNAPLFKGQPLTWVDFDTHAEQTQRGVQALDRWGKTWVYDPQLLAGYPNGAVFEIDNKGWELWTFALWKAGLKVWTAFNLFVLLAHLLVAPVVYWSARLFGLERWESLGAAVLAIMIWFFDGLARWSWFSGAIAFSIVAVGFLLPLALFYRWLEERKTRHWVALALSLALGHLVHPSIFVSLVVPMTALYVRRFKALGWRGHVCVGVAAAFTIAFNAFWLYTAFRFAHYVTDHNPFFVARPSQAIADFLGLVVDLTTTGLIGNRTAFRILATGAAIIGLVALRKQRDRRFLPLATGIGFLLLLAYLGGEAWLLRQIQPYRSVVPAAFLATIPAAYAVGQLVRSRALREVSWLGRSMFGLAVVLSLSLLFREAAYFLPRQLPQVPALPTGETLPFTALGFPPHDDFRHGPPFEEFDHLTQWAEAHAPAGQGRVLIDWWVIGEHLLWRTDTEVLGGFHERNLQHNAANLFKRHPEGIAPDDTIARYFEDYAVRWVILTEERPYFESRTSVLELVARVDRHRIYRTKVPISYFQQGGGRIGASLNRLQVRGTDPDQDQVLRYHWLETLRCEPGCTVERSPVEGDRVGFIRIPAPHPPDFDVVNAY